MLVLSRRLGEKIVIGDNVVVTIVEVHRDSVRIGIDAPRSVPVNRAELLAAVGEENKAATSSDVDAAATLAALRGIRARGSNARPVPRLTPGAAGASGDARAAMRRMTQKAAENSTEKNAEQSGENSAAKPAPAAAPSASADPAPSAGSSPTSPSS